MRRYIRHPASIPIEITTGGALSGQSLAHTSNVGECGLAFHSDRELAPGALVNVRISAVKPEFESAARVAWCHGNAEGYELGVEFTDPNEAFRARMIEQVCHIENYRNEVLASEGRQLTPDQAAVEWVGKFASQFPDADKDTAE